MKKRFLPFSLLLVIMILGQAVIADQGGHYVPRTQPTMNAEGYMGSLRANQNTGLIDPADMFKAMQAPVTKDASNDPLYWINMGPDNMGGQTTAVLYDNGSNAVYIGSKGGGVYKTYNFGVTWHQVGNFNLLVSTMVQDKDGVIYVGTGDGGDNVSHNGLTDMNYDNSFIGTGIYTIDTHNDDLMVRIVAPTADEWLYVNELAIVGNTLLAATPEGLKYSTDKGGNWQVAIEGNAAEVKTGANVIVASVDGLIYIGTDVNNMVCHSHTGTNDMQGDTLLPKAAGLLDIAIAPKDDNIIYASCIDGSGDHTGVLVSRNMGATWSKILSKVSSGMGHTIYDSYGLYNHGIVVDPADDGVLYVTGHTLWRLTRPSTGNGYYQCLAITSNSTVDSPAYLHVGLHTIVFNPKNENEYYIGTDGGVYKGDRDFYFQNCNRNYVTSRMFNVAFSGKDSRVMAAGLDHGTVLIEGAENTNTPGSGTWINPTGDNMGMWSESSSAGHCAFSMINPNTIFVTYTEGGFQRSETAGEDWVSTNFTSSLSSFSTSLFRVPFLLYEDYDADWNPATVWYYNTTDHTQNAGVEVECFSNNDYPFNYTLEANLHAGDSVEVHDPIGAKMFLTYKDNLYMTLTPLDFALETQWIKIAGKLTNTILNNQPEAAAYNYTGGEPNSIAVSADGDNLFVGYLNGKMYRLTHLNTVTDATTGTYYITGDTILNPDCQVVTKSFYLYNDPNDESTKVTHCVTSIAVNPRHPERVLVTLGNYGNENYVFYSNNAMAENPVFVPVQGNLPKMPVYSSVIEMATGDVIIGTERGIYRTKNINAANVEWIADSQMLGEIPVMDLKQQLLEQEDKQISNVTEDGVFVTIYPGVHNTGIIYAATYGKGVFRCENYKKTALGVHETPAVVETTVSLYPNPVKGVATVSFNATENAEASYQVFDLTGRLVKSQSIGKVAEGANEFSISTENLSTGSYILRLNHGGNTSCVKFMVY